MLLICPAINPPIHSLVRFAQTDFGSQHFFQPAVDQVLAGQGHDQLVLCLLVMLRYQELISPGQEPDEPVHPRSAMEDFCHLLSNEPIPAI